MRDTGLLPPSLIPHAENAGNPSNPVAAAIVKYNSPSPRFLATIASNDAARPLTRPSPKPPNLTLKLVACRRQPTTVSPALTHIGGARAPHVRTCSATATSIDANRPPTPSRCGSFSATAKQSSCASFTIAPLSAHPNDSQLYHLASFYAAPPQTSQAAAASPSAFTPRFLFAPASTPSTSPPPLLRGRAGASGLLLQRNPSLS